MVSLYIYFRPTLTQDDIDNDNIGRQFRAGLVSSTEAGVQKLTLRSRYVLVRNNVPLPAANVGKFFYEDDDYNIVRAISKEVWIGATILSPGTEKLNRIP